MYGRPQKSTMPVTGEYYCGLYAFAYAFTYYNPDVFVKGAIDLFQTGKANINGINITSSKALKEQQPTKNIALYILTASAREYYNNFTDAGSNKFWSSTGSGDMTKFLKNIAGLKVSEYSYGHEEFADGITNKDLLDLQKHVNGGDLAILRVSYEQFNKNKKVEPGGARVAGGDHWVVLQKIHSFDIDKNEITVDIYDNHEGLQIKKTFSYDAFKDMIYHVIKVDK